MATNETRQAAYKETYKALRKKKLIRKNKCELCDETQNIHGHHEDYQKPLEVVWLCPTHHFERHRKQMLRLESSLKRNVYSWARSVGRRNAEKALTEAGVSLSVAQKLLAGTYGPNPKQDLEKAILTAISGKVAS